MLSVSVGVARLTPRLVALVCLLRRMGRVGGSDLCGDWMSSESEKGVSVSITVGVGALVGVVSRVGTGIGGASSGSGLVGLGGSSDRVVLPLRSTV